MPDRFSPDQAAVIDRDNRNMAAAGIAMSQVLNDLQADIDSGTIGITADAGDVDSLSLGGGTFTRDRSTANGSSLLFAWKASRFHNGKSLVTVSAGSLTLGASSTNYLEVDRAGTVSSNTTGFTAGRLPLWQIVAGVSSYSDANVASRKPLITLVGTSGVDGSMLSVPGQTKEIELPLGTISATSSFCILAPATSAIITSASFVTKDALAASDTNYFDFGLVNKGAAGSGTTQVVDRTLAANSTKLTGGAGITAYVRRALSLSGTPANLATASEDVLEFTITKTGTPTNLTQCTVRLDFAFTN